MSGTHKAFARCVVVVVLIGAIAGGPVGGASAVLPKPVLSSITPTVGPAAGGTLVTLSGANFLGATKVAFGASASSSFTVENDTRITALAPARPAGVAAIKVTTPGGTSAAVTAGKFTYVGVPVVKTVSPKVLPPAGGTLITVTGAGFTGVSSVAVDGTPATAVSIVSATKLTAVAPPHVIGAVAVAVVGPAGASAPSAAATLTYANAATLTSIVPISGPAAGGNPVTLTGSGFTGTSVVKFASTVAPSFTVVDDSTIVATTPPRAAGTTAIAVTTPMGKAVATPTAKYTFVTAPTVTSLVRGSGLATGGSAVTIFGTGFTGASSVTFGGVAAPFTLVNTETIIATTPAHSAGEVDVRVATPGGPNPVGPASRFWYFPIDGRAPDGRTSLFMGQELGAVGGLTGYDQGYADYVGSPAGVTIYTDLRYPVSLRQPLDLGSGVLCGSCYLNSRRFDRSAIAVGLYMVDELPAIVAGSYDASIDSLADWIKEADRPVFLRIGYEFDGSWNHYDPAQYVQAFRRIMDRLDARGADNAISVWQSAGATATTSTLMQWYPGDDYVDWVAYSYFKQSNPGTTSLAVARSRAKPVMIAESTPQRNLSLGDPVAHWNAWFQPFFNHIHANQDVIKAVAYINTRWFDQPQWSAAWGDSRVQIRPEIKSRWLTEMQSPIWDPGDLAQAGNTYVLTPHDLTPP